MNSFLCFNIEIYVQNYAKNVEGKHKLIFVIRSKLFYYYSMACRKLFHFRIFPSRKTVIEKCTYQKNQIKLIFHTISQTQKLVETTARYATTSHRQKASLSSNINII